MKVTVRVPAERLELVREKFHAFHEILADMQNQPCFNPDQSLSLEEDKLTYVGQRYPLVYDGALSVFHAACVPGTGGLTQLEVLEYETSEPAMEWYETLEDVLKRALYHPDYVEPDMEAFVERHRFVLCKEAAETGRIRSSYEWLLRELVARGMVAIIPRR